MILWNSNTEFSFAFTFATKDDTSFDILSHTDAFDVELRQYSIDKCKI